MPITIEPVQAPVTCRPSLRNLHLHDTKGGARVGSYTDSATDRQRSQTYHKQRPRIHPSRHRPWSVTKSQTEFGGSRTRLQPFHEFPNHQLLGWLWYRSIVSTLHCQTSSMVGKEQGGSYIFNNHSKPRNAFGGFGALIKHFLDNVPRRCILCCCILPYEFRLKSAYIHNQVHCQCEIITIRAPWNVSSAAPERHEEGD